MIFNLLNKKEEKNHHPVFIDKTYLTTEGKMNALAALAFQDVNVIFITWFPETTKKLKEFFFQQNIDKHRIIETKHVYHSKLAGHTAVFAEHFPIHTKEATLCEKWVQKSIVVYSALDEPLFMHFGGEKILEMIQKMGMNEKEAIEHPLVSKSILNIQEKIAEKVFIEQFAVSQSAWMENNLK